MLVEGNAELTPTRLVGHHDASRVLTEDYRPENFVPGPLTRAMTEGALLYVEEFNRVPEETMNVLLGVLSEREMHVPRYGRVAARPTFRLVAAMNPFDAVGTARVTPGALRPLLPGRDGLPGRGRRAAAWSRRRPAATRTWSPAPSGRCGSPATTRSCASAPRCAAPSTPCSSPSSWRTVRDDRAPLEEATGLDAALAAMTGKVTARRRRGPAGRGRRRRHLAPGR